MRTHASHHTRGHSMLRSTPGCHEQFCLGLELLQASRSCYGSGGGRLRSTPILRCCSEAHNTGRSECLAIANWWWPLPLEGVATAVAAAAAARAEALGWQMGGGALEKGAAVLLS